MNSSMSTSSASSTTGDRIIRASGLGKSVRSGDSELTILDDINLEVFRGERVAVVGVSGSGKSTLLGLLAGLDQASRGEVELLGESLGPLDEDQRSRLRRGQVGFVFQNFQLLSGLNALENVLLALELGDADHSASLEDAAREALEAVGLSERLGHFAAQLSGGEQQRVAIARAFAPGPQILFADEPTGNLDRETGNTIVELLLRMNTERNTTLFIVTHDHNLAERCDRIVSIEQGRLTEQT